MDFVVALDCIITVSDSDGEVDDTDAIIEAHLDEVMNEMMALGTRDPSIELDLTTGQVSFSVLVESANPIGAAAAASGFVRTAIHAAGGATPDWPGPTHEAWAVQWMALRSSPADAPATDEDGVDGHPVELVGA